MIYRAISINVLLVYIILRGGVVGIVSELQGLLPWGWMWVM